MIARLLALGDERAVAGRREEAADAGAGRRGSARRTCPAAPARPRARRSGTAARTPCSRRRRSRSSSGPAAPCSRMPMPKSSTPALLLMTVRSRVPRACSAWIRFSGMPHRPKPPIRIVAPSGMRATAASALGSTLFIAGDYTERSAGAGATSAAPARHSLAASKTSVSRVAASRGRRRSSCSSGDQRVERRADLVGVGGGDVLPDVGRARRQPRGVDQAAAGQRQALLAAPPRRRPASARWPSAAAGG